MTGRCKIDIYNEFSLQHELGIHLRQEDVLKPYIVQFERPVSFFGIYPDGLVKKEIDIAVFARDPQEKVAIELKAPGNGIS